MPKYLDFENVNRYYGAMVNDELTGYKLVSKLKRTRRKINLTATEQALYHELIDKCNEGDWSEIFDCSNDELRSALLISENTLIASRLSLINAGLIFYKSGKSKRKFGQYSFTKRLSTTSNFEVDTGVDAEVVTGGDTGVDASDYNKHKPNSKLKHHSEANASGADTSSGAIKKEKRKKGSAAKKENITEHWQPLVDVWFEFYRKNPGKGENPTFEGQSPASLKKIIEWLKKRSEAKNLGWDEKTACDTLLKFLTYAYGLQWIKDNFLLQNLERQFDKIVNQNGNGTSKGGPADLSAHKAELARKMGLT